MVGNIGQGPGEYVTLGEFLIDENHKEVYIVGGGILVYDFEGNFKRNVIMHELSVLQQKEKSMDTGSSGEGKRRLLKLVSIVRIFAMLQQ